VDHQLRRRSVGAPAARSVLLTVLGEYVLPLSDGVWQETLASALETIGHTNSAARQALVRSVKAGWLEAERHGRRSRVRLSAGTADILRTGAERIYSFGDPWEWDGRWLLVVLRVPEERREVRHQIRTQLAWSGFGALGGGLWLSPHVEREPLLRELSTNGSGAELASFRAEIGMLADADELIAEAWDLEAVSDRYRAFIDDLARLRPRSPEATFRAQTLLVHAWRRFPFLDPDLPADVLPAGWPRERAHELFEDRHARWHEAAQSYFRSLESLRAAA
jgi:phenylacetic acid degradation operon negative regulatory protein